jgi:diacylglycerol O-acyltransferase
MKQLSAMDTSFLSLETATQFGHVASLIVLDPSTSKTGDIYADVRRMFDERLHLLEIYRRKLVSDPLGIANPYWVDDANMDLEFHLREIALPAPGTERQLGEQVARIIARPLDRTRPLWEWYVISGLADGNVAILTKIHHATIDGASGAEMLHVLLDAESEGRHIEAPIGPLSIERTPTPLELAGRAMLELISHPAKAMSLQMQMLRAGAALGGNRAFQDMVTTSMPRWRPFGARHENGSPPPLTAVPRTPFNGVITAHRRLALRTLRLSDAQAVKRTFGVTINDVVMALCADVLRRYLAERDTLPDAPLAAMVPVSVRTGADEGAGSNRVTGVVSSLHTNIVDPVERLTAIHRSMTAAKELQRAVPATVLTDISQFTPPVLAAQAARLASGIRIADFMNPPFNVVISNVPGPRQPLYLSGATMKHFYPVSMVVDGLGLNMTVQSYLNNLDFGFVACREMVPDLWDMTAYLDDALAELLERARGIEAPAGGPATTAPPMRRRPSSPSRRRG